MGLGYVVTGILYRGLCPDALNDPKIPNCIIKRSVSPLELKSQV